MNGSNIYFKKRYVVLMYFGDTWLEWKRYRKARSALDAVRDLRNDERKLKIYIMRNTNLYYTQEKTLNKNRL